jgi:arsenite oxidase small subunit
MTQEPQWKHDFPVSWEHDHYVTRRELVKFLTLGSGLLAGASGAILIWDRRRGEEGFYRRGLEVRVGSAEEPAPGGSRLFRYPTSEDPCILIRRSDGSFVAYSQVCTHLSCAVVHRPKTDDLLCPCHHGIFAASDGRPLAGPPTRRLPRILLERRGGELFAIGVEV